MDVKFWLCARWNMAVCTLDMVVWMLDFGCVNVHFCWVYDRFGLCGRLILVVFTLDLGCLDVGIWLFGRLILVG